jgi:predicted transposase/invertase (TIGR01784 family)
MIEKFLDPKYDIAFKRIFGTPRNVDILIRFLNDVLEFEDDQMIQEVEFLANEQHPEQYDFKTNIIDILCKDKSDKRYIIEMQVRGSSAWSDRICYYASKTYVEQLKESESYQDLKPLYFIGILNFNMFKDDPSYRTVHKTLNIKTFSNSFKAFTFVFLELRKFKKELHQLNTMCDKWCYFFKNAQKFETKDLYKLSGDDFIIKRAYKELERYAWKESDRLLYDANVKQKIDLESAFLFAQDASRTEGLLEGEKKQSVKIAQIAKSLLEKGCDLNLISETTGLSFDQIREL